MPVPNGTCTQNALGMFRYKDVAVKYTVKNSQLARNIRIEVTRDQEVVVTRPPFVEDGEMEKFVLQKRGWILKSLDFYANKMKELETSQWTQINYAACKGQAKKLIQEKVQKFNVVYRYEIKKISVRQQKSKWGSCTSNKCLSFNYKLLFLPAELSDYIVVHELCHLREMNHSKRFWKLVEKAVPDYRRRDQELKHYLP